MKVLVVGGRGSIGSRYAAIVTMLGHEAIVLDPGPSDTIHIPSDVFNYDMSILAVPTPLHYNYARHYLSLKKPLLCEKPLCKDLIQANMLANQAEHSKAYVVNNYTFVTSEKIKTVYYDYFRTGHDGVLWDACQLIYLDSQAVIRTKSPVFVLTLNDKRIPLQDVEESYVEMIRAYLNGDEDKLWTFRDGVRMTRKVIQRINHESTTRNSSPN